MKYLKSNVAVAFLLAGSVFISLAVFAEEGGGHYQLHGDVVPIPEDGIHDPENDAVKTLQPPAEAMRDFPRDARGVINWVETLDSGIIAPRTGLTGSEKMHSVDFDVIFKNTASISTDGALV